MQSSASRRALSALASKLHPQVPLTDRESQQLLNLLTKSFRAHLDREHPVTASEDSQLKPTRQSPGKKFQRNASFARPESSHGSTHHHINSILTNPLFAVKPSQRELGAAPIDVLKDPVAWFRDQVAIGAADLLMADMCLEILESSVGTLHGLYDRTRPGTLIAEWLSASGIDTSAKFVQLHSLKPTGKQFLNRLISLLVAEGVETPIWRWFTRHPEQRVRETGLAPSCIMQFRLLLLLGIVSAKSRHNPNEAVMSFLKALRMMRGGEYGVTHQILQPAGAHLVNGIKAPSGFTITPELYDLFLSSTRQWLGLNGWYTAVESMLWVHHPTKSTAVPGLNFIRDPQGAITFVSHSQSRKNFLVQLCLDVARQLVAEGKHADANLPMNFAKDHFPEIVFPRNSVFGEKQDKIHRKKHNEQQNLELLDQLIPT